MIGTLIRINWLTLRRDRVALLLTFVLPIVFFSVFAMVLAGGSSRGGTARIRVAIADEDHSEASRRLLDAIRAEPALRVRSTTDGASSTPLDRAGATALVTDGTVPVAIVLLPGLGERFGDFTATAPSIDLLVDSADPMAGPMVTGLLQRLAMSAMPDLVAERGMANFERFVGDYTPAQQERIDRMMPFIRAMGRDDGTATQTEPPPSNGAAGEADAGGPAAGDDSTDGDPAPAPSSIPAPAPAPAPAGAGFGGPIGIETTDVVGESKRSGVIAFFAAGTAVMFLLFSMAGAAGTLLDEEEAGTLERLLTSGLGVSGLIVGKWSFYTVIGMLQITVMFLWAWAVFRLELFDHLTGFTVMTVVTAAAAAAFGLLLAGLCRSRAQLNGISTVVILLMSAVGGSMFPRFMMPEWMRSAGLATFNAWALDGYQKVFWYDRPLLDLWPQVLVLLSLTALFLLGARLLGRRWEAD